MGLPAISVDGFTLRAENRAGKFEVTLAGNADMRVVSELDAALESLASTLPKASPEIAFDIRELYFMNSSCFKCFVSFIVGALDLPAAERYKVVFLSNPRMHWQDRSLEALRSIATEIVRVETR
jgi:hypothetical protein